MLAFYFILNLIQLLSISISFSLRYKNSYVANFMNYGKTRLIRNAVCSQTFQQCLILHSSFSKWESHLAIIARNGSYEPISIVLWMQYWRTVSLSGVWTYGSSAIPSRMSRSPPLTSKQNWSELQDTFQFYDNLTDIAQSSMVTDILYTNPKIDSTKTFTGK